MIGNPDRNFRREKPSYVKAALRNIATTTNEVNRMKPKHFLSRWATVWLGMLLGISSVMLVIMALRLVLS